MIRDRAIDLLVEATRDLTVIVLQTQDDLTPDQVTRLRRVAIQVLALIGEEPE